MFNKMMMAVACLSAATMFGQSMETVKVKLPYETRVGGVALPAGSYSIRQISSSVVEFTSDAHNGVNTFASVMRIVAPNQETKQHTSVVLKHDDKGYELDKIWLEGQDLGFELSE